MIEFTPTRPDSADRAQPGWKEERLVDDAGDETFLSYRGAPTLERYEFIRDYLEFRIKRLKPVDAPPEQGTDLPIGASQGEDTLSSI